MEKLKLGIIGVGNMGSGHVRNILSGQTPEIEIAAVADRRPDRRNWAQEHLPKGAPVFEEGSELIGSGLPYPTTSTRCWPKRPLPRACM